jgi:hypothetical protein
MSQNVTFAGNYKLILMKKISLLLPVFAALFISAFTISGCARGEDDPWLTIHTRDARLTQPWKMTGMTGSVVTTVDGNTTNVEYEFDGTNIYITTNGATVSYAYTFGMEIQDNGEVFSEETMNEINSGDIVQQSSKTSYWYWGNDDKNKTSAVLDLTGILADYKSYDIPRLAWNDMSLEVDYSDNYTIQVNDSTYSAGSIAVLLQIDFEVDLTTP